jgi:glutamate synthase domain-containing protein 2
MEEWIKEIRERALKGKPIVSAGRSNKLGRISFDDLVFAPSQFCNPLDYYREEIETETILGTICNKPLKLKIPIIFGAMSFGAISKEAKIAIAKASSELGTATNTGEGGMLAEERENARYLIFQYSTGRFGADEETIKKADAIEIKIGQGAKPNMGGLLPAEKVTEEIAKIRKVELGKDVHSPPSHPDIKSAEDLRKKVEWLRSLNDGPIIIKLAATSVENDVKIAAKANPDAIAIDGMEGGTGAAPVIMLNDFGIPTLAALAKARKALDELKAKQQLLIGGGINKGSEIAKCLALGADCVFMATSILVAMGCTYCRMCYLGKCPFGIATQEPELRKKLNVEDAKNKIVKFVSACVEEVKMASAACGKKNVHELNKKDLRALSLEVSKITGIELV